MHFCVQTIHVLLQCIQVTIVRCICYSYVQSVLVDVPHADFGRLHLLDDILRGLLGVDLQGHPTRLAEGHPLEVPAQVLQRLCGLLDLLALQLLLAALGPGLLRAKCCDFTLNLD